MNQGEQPRDRLLFVGTGVSSGIPSLGHLVGPEILKDSKGITTPCEVCLRALRNKNDKNRRNNVSILLRLNIAATGEPDEFFELLVDCGKTFRSAYLTTMWPRGIHRVDTLFLTHDHADAVLGLEYLHALQTFDAKTVSETEDSTHKRWRARVAIPTYCTVTTWKSLASSCSSVFHHSIRHTGSDSYVTAERCTALKPHLIPEFDLHECLIPLVPLEEKCSAGTAQPHHRPPSFLPVTFLPLYHGGQYICTGYSFGGHPGALVVYLSDADRIPDSTLDYLSANNKNNMSNENNLNREIDMLIVDCLQPHTSYSHFGLEECWNVILALQPTTVYCVGMCCDLEHDALANYWEERLRSNQNLVPRTQHIYVAYDGLELSIDFGIRPMTDG